MSNLRKYLIKIIVGKYPVMMNMDITSDNFTINNRDIKIVISGNKIRDFYKSLPQH
ncbi:hypothetical protein AB0Y20_00720 [Heyndrickxia oleronia]|uniref:hypothetical protein n=1 Tax=Heyndrickxia oleronia TaxID=38875 RepID=UPI003F1F62AE